MTTVYKSDVQPNPRHVAIIMDGNGRWAQSQGKERAYGHIQGIDSVRKVIQAAAKAGVEVLTLYTFSEENWNRPQEEVEALMSLLISSIQNEMGELMSRGVRLQAIGALDKLPSSARRALEEAIQTTSVNKTITVVLALSYSSHTEIISAIKVIAQKIEQKQLKTTEIDTTTISTHLYTHNLPDPDLLIRTGGECRLSNFLLWQMAYTELYFCDKYWPDFGEEDFSQALSDYRNRQRRFGKTSEQIASKQL